MSFPCLENVILLALTIQRESTSIYIFWLPLWCPKTLFVRFGRVWSIVKKLKFRPRSLVWCVVFVDQCLLFCRFDVGLLCYLSFFSLRLLLINHLFGIFELVYLYPRISFLYDYIWNTTPLLLKTIY
jgi:hypothetical protein